MIERQIVSQKVKEKDIEEFIFSFLGDTTCSHIQMQRTPLGERISVYTSRPGLIVGRKGANIKKLTDILKTKFSMENPQLEVVEIPNAASDAASISRSLMMGFERFGPKRFKAMAYKALEDALRSGARGIEIVIGGRGVPGERAKSWRFSAGYLKKSGDISENFMDRSYKSCNLRSGTIGIKVSVLHPDVQLPDEIIYKSDKPEIVVQTSEIKVETVNAEEVKVEEAKIAEPEAPKKAARKPRVKKVKAEEEKNAEVKE
ncbi:MAG TPA: 30S ribosomal protein S3 [Candidatus Nanoarchaeia archaeon]|nr:30S ribosomal protein S3 [Candidatus Nanoarchaeia archaeon]